MRTYEIYDADPMQDPDSHWHETIRARSVSGLRRQANARVRGSGEYPAGTTLWYIARDAEGNVESRGTFEL